MNWLRTMVAQPVDPKLEQVQQMIKAITLDDAIYALRPTEVDGIYDLFLDMSFGPVGTKPNWDLVGKGSLDEIIKSLEQEYRESLRKNSGEYYG